MIASPSNPTKRKRLYMSLEQKLEALTIAVTKLTEAMTAVNTAPAQVTAVPTVAATPVVPEPAPMVAAQPDPVAASPSDQAVQYAQAAAGMPALPSFVAPVAAPAAPTAPFTEPKGLMDYLMKAYNALGPQKGAQIQGVLVGLGYQNVNDIKPEHYGALFAGVEALK
jgi:hypothetical protein